MRYFKLAINAIAITVATVVVVGLAILGVYEHWRFTSEHYGLWSALITTLIPPFAFIVWAVNQ